jgi:hypothetical protein
MITTTSPGTKMHGRGSLVAMAIVVAVLIVVSVAVPYAVLVAAPVLLLLGTRMLRRETDATARTLGWVAVASGLILALLVAFVVLGLMAAGTGGVMSEVGPVEQVQP